MRTIGGPPRCVGRRDREFHCIRAPSEEANSAAVVRQQALGSTTLDCRVHALYDRPNRAYAQSGGTARVFGLGWIIVQIRLTGLPRSSGFAVRAAAGRGRRRL